MCDFEKNVGKQDMKEMNENAERATARRQWKIVSGGQTGVDRAGLSAAMACGLPYGGWIPKGRRTEDGTVPRFYCCMKEHASAGYMARTKANVRDSDATLVIAAGIPLSPGTQLTVDTARRIGRPFKVVCLRDDDAVSQIRDWMLWLEATVRPGDASAIVLNVAGPRESKSPGAFSVARRILVQAFDCLRASSGDVGGATGADVSSVVGKNASLPDQLMLSEDIEEYDSGFLAADRLDAAASAREKTGRPSA